MFLNHPHFGASAGFPELARSDLEINTSKAMEKTKAPGSAKRQHCYGICCSKTNRGCWVH